MNLEWLKDKRLRLVANALSAFLGSILLFAGLVNLFGYFYTIAISIIGFLVLWIVVSQAIEKAAPQPLPIASLPNTTRPNVSLSPKTSSSLNEADSSASAAPALHPVCEIGPHEVDAGEILTIQLNVKQGQKVKGHLEEVDGQPFDWYIADEKKHGSSEEG